MAGPSDVFLESLREKHQHAIDALAFLANGVYGGQPDNVLQEHAKRAYGRAVSLSELLPAKRVPNWLDSLKKNLSALAGEFRGNRPLLAETIVLLRGQLESHHWDFEPGPQVDFEAMCNNYYREYGIESLFTEVIRLLEAIIASGEIDSLRMKQSLEDVLAVAKKGKSSSFLAQMFTWNFLKEWMRNSVWEYAYLTPLAGPLVKALKKTIDEGSEKFEQVGHNAEEMVATAADQFLITSYLPVLPSPTKVSESAKLAQSKNDEDE